MIDKRAVAVFAVGFMLALSIVFTAVFMIGVVNGGRVVLLLDEYGEMIPELLVLTLVVWPTIGVGLWYLAEADDRSQ